MGDFPNAVWPPLNTITTTSMESLGIYLAATRVSAAESANNIPVANQAYYVPFNVMQPSLAVKISWINGSIVSGTVDAGIYNGQGKRLVSSGATTQSGTTTIQTVDTTDTLLVPGLHFMALLFSTGSARFHAFGIADEQVFGNFPFYEQAVGSATLPDPFTLSLSTAGTVLIPHMAVHFDTLV